MRIDKFLWCVRLFKSRSLATQSCHRGQVKVNDAEVKPSREIGVGDTLAVRIAPIWRSFRIRSIPASRVGAKVVADHLEETTPLEDLERQEVARKVRSLQREPRAGRPTKQERRNIDRFLAG